MSNLPSNRLYDLPLPPPPRNHQVQFTLESPSPIYPQIVCTIYPPKIAKSDLPSNRLYDLPPPNRQVQFTLKSPSPIYPQIICTIYPPRNRQVRFTLKSPSLIYPSNRLYNKSDLLKLGGVNRTDDLRVSQTWRFRGGKSYRRFEGKSDLTISGGVNCPTFFIKLILFIFFPNMIF